MRLFRIGVPFAVLGIALAQGPNRPQGPAPNQQQPPRPQPMQPQPPQSADFSALKSYLNLTDAQIRQMEQAREKAAREADEKEKAVRPQIQEKRGALADLMEKDAPDATAVGRMMLDIRSLEKQIRAAHEAVRTAGISVMSPEQKAKFKAIQDAANLPAATRDAQRLGLVPGQPQGPGPNPGMSPGMGGPRPRMQGPMGPGRMGPGDDGPQMRGPGQPMAPSPARPRQGDPEGDR